MPRHVDSGCSTTARLERGQVYSSRGDVAASARLTALGEVAVTVADTGIGMDPKEIPRALQPFGQVESVLTRTQGRTGLGLPLARRLVELHGGEMTIERARAAGTTVTFTLPPERTRKPGLDATETAWTRTALRAFHVGRNE
jgi:signal transduction histidine kinase